MLASPMKANIRPMVTVSCTTSSLPCRCRMIARSRKIPSAGAITSTVSGTAITWGTPWFTDSSQSTYARNMPIAPCAKLKMPVVVYTTTSPVADIARMPAIGSAKMTMSTRVVNVTGLPAHAAQLTTTTRRAVAARTSRLDRVFTTGRSSLVRLHRVHRDRDDPAVAVELARFDRVDAHELAALHLHANQAPGTLSRADVGRRDESAGIEVVDLLDRLQHAGPGNAVGAALRDDLLDSLRKCLARDPRLRAEAVGLLVVLEEGIELVVVTLVLERQE